MGEVYRARDTKLKREVALKVLPPEFAREPERLARAQREAEVLASLNHPHVAQIYGLEESGGIGCLVLEFVAGETLQQRLRRGPIAVEDALEIARQISDAVGAAHERGIVHRDLKPANVMITPTGQVKVLDFGLAKPVGSEPWAADASQSPTLMSGAVSGGVILGTAAYMSPEQAKGKSVDARSDVWAFGVVLYEMLSGKPAFGGETIVEILGGVMKVDPDWTRLPGTTPPIVRSLLRRCFTRDPNRRLQNITDARIEIEEAQNDLAHPGAPFTPVRKRSERWLWMGALVASLAAGSLLTGWYIRRTPADVPEVRLQINTQPAANPTAFAISPDGRSVVYQGVAEGKPRLWLRRLDSETASPLAGTDNAIFPFWSADSRSIGFFADQKLMRVDIAGGTPRALADAPQPIGSGAWNASGVILFNPGNSGPLQRVSAEGGTPVEATRVEPPRNVVHRFPAFLPDGRHFLFYAAGTPEGRGVYVGSIDGMGVRRLFDADSAAVFVPPDHVLFVRQETLFAQHLDLAKLEVQGEPFPVAEPIATEDRELGAASGEAALSASAAGLLAYRTANPRPRQLVWFDRTGKQTGVVGEPAVGQLGDLRLSSDGGYVALSRAVKGNTDVWLIETARNVPQRLTFDAELDCCPVWKPDGSSVVFQSRRKGLRDLYQRLLAGALGSETMVLESGENKEAQDWSPDGRFILYIKFSRKTGADLWVLPVDDSGKPDGPPTAVAATPAIETNGRFSPDSRWIAYQSNETGENEIYVQPFPGPGRRSQISIKGGTAPQWRSDGRELFYMAPGNKLMAAPLAFTPDGRSVNVGTPSALFTLQQDAQYAPAPGGQRFLVNLPLGQSVTPPITVVLNWSGRKP
jgi:serine/threonine protein kinase